MNFKSTRMIGRAMSAALIAFALASPSLAQDIQERTIRGGVVSPGSHPSSQGLTKFGELLSEKSSGKITLQTYFSGQIGDDKKMIEATQAGIQDVVVTSTSPLMGIVPQFGIFDIPFVFNNVEEGASVLDGSVGDQLLSLLPERRLVGLAFFENGMRNLTNSKHPVAKAADFDGLRIRVQQNQVHIATFATLGANPIPLPYTEVFGALETKTIDGAENALPVFVSDNYHEVQDYVSLTEHVYAPILLGVSQRLWDGLSDDEKAIFQEAAMEARDFQRQVNRAAVAEAIETLKAAGMEVNSISPEDRAQIQEQVAPVVAQFSAELAPDLMAEVERSLAALRALKN